MFLTFETIIAVIGESAENPRLESHTGGDFIDV
jgi:hypothetical protein